MSFKSFLNSMSSFIIFLSFFSFSAWAENGEGHLGEIRYSILGEAQFQELYGTEWELMKGQSLDTHSKLRGLWGKDNLPDARGVFLRSMNHGRAPSDGNPDEGNLKIGDYQQDQIKSHKHSISVRGSVFYSRLVQDRPEWLTGLAAGGLFAGHGRDGVARDGMPDTNGAGGSETRPRCILVNTFIKVKESPQQPKVEKTLSEKIQEITQHPDFEASVTAIVQEILHQRH